MNRHRLDSPATSSRTVLTFHLKDNLDNAKIKPTHKKLATQMLEGEHSSASKRGLKDVLLRGDDLFIAPAPKKPKSIGISQPQGKNEAPLKARKTGTDPKSTKTKAPGKPKLAKDPNCAKVPRKSRAPKVTLESDPTIITDNAKISTLLSQGKTWRFNHHFGKLTAGKLRITFRIIIPILSRNATMSVEMSLVRPFPLKMYTPAL